MTQGTTFNIYVMSYRRPDKILTKDLLEYCTYVVREDEADAYRASGVTDLLVIPKDARTQSGARVWNFITTLYWIIENTPEDVIFIADDDIKNFMYRMNFTTNITKEYFENPKSVATAEIERIAQLLVDLNLGLATDTPQHANYAYDKEFSFKCMPGGVRWINKKCLKATLDPNSPCASDVDMVMQELLKNRIMLCPKYFCGGNIMEKNAGGTTVTSDENLRFRIALHNKWGRYWNFDRRKNQGIIRVQR